MLQDLLLSEFVVADPTFDNPNVWYEIGVRHSLRSGGTVMTYALSERLPLNIAWQRTQRYTLKEGKLDPDRVAGERTVLTEASKATLGVPLTKLVNSLKGVSSRRMRQMHPTLRPRYRKGVLWSPSYFAASCGGAPVSIIRQYIERQRNPQSDSCANAPQRLSPA